MNNQDGETKICKHCQSEIPKKAKVCPNCRKKQGGKLKWIILAVVALAIIGSAMGGNDSKKDVKKVEKVSSDTDGKTEEQASEPVEEPSNIFNVGDVVETEDFKITYESAVPYTRIPVITSLFSRKTDVSIGSLNSSLKIFLIQTSRYLQ